MNTSHSISIGLRKLAWMWAVCLLLVSCVNLPSSTPLSPDQQTSPLPTVLPNQVQTPEAAVVMQATPISSPEWAWYYAPRMNITFGLPAGWHIDDEDESDADLLASGRPDWQRLPRRTPNAFSNYVTTRSKDNRKSIEIAIQSDEIAAGQSLLEWVRLSEELAFLGGGSP